VTLTITHYLSQSVTDLRIGHGLGPRAFVGPAQLFPMTSLTTQILTKNLRNCAEA